MSPQDRRGLSARRRASSSPFSPSISAAGATLKALAAARRRGRARLHGGAARRRHRQPLADARARRRALASRAFSSATARARSGRSRPCARRRCRRPCRKPLADRGGASASPTPICAPARSASPGSWPATPPCWRCSTAAGLRISEALGLTRGRCRRPARATRSRSPARATRRAWCRCCRRCASSIADYVALCPYDLPADGPLFVGAKGGPLSPRIVQLAMAAAARRARPAGDRDAARAAPFLRHAPAGARRRPARDPGTARPRLAVDDADLHRRRHRAAAGGLSQRPSAGVTGTTISRNRRSDASYLRQ